MKPQSWVFKGKGIINRLLVCSLGDAPAEVRGHCGTEKSNNNIMCIMLSMRRLLCNSKVA